MELHRFKETLLEFLSDVTHVSEESKRWFLDKPDAKGRFKAPQGFKVLSPYVLVKVETSSKVPDGPKPTREEGDTSVIEKPKEEIYHCIVRFRIYTNEHCYSISATWLDYTAQYLGCTASARTPRAGEQWTRGNDLPDGYFCRETWNHIKNAMFRYEMDALSKYIAHGRHDNPEEKVK